MDIKGTYKFAAAPQAVWDGLHNSAILKSAIPGVQDIAWQGDSAIQVRASVPVVNKEANISIPITEHTPPSHLKAEFHGAQVSGYAIVDLVPDGTGTLLSYNADFNVSGPMAAMVTMAKPMISGQINQVFGRLDAAIH
jgi:carbon monoxide dehydrogenase subunit G